MLALDLLISTPPGFAHLVEKDILPIPSIDALVDKQAVFIDPVFDA